MDQHILEATPLVAGNPNRRMDKALANIDKKSKQLKAMGMTIHDQELLQHRLSHVWGSPNLMAPGHRKRHGERPEPVVRIQRFRKLMITSSLLLYWLFRQRNVLRKPSIVS